MFHAISTLARLLLSPSNLLLLLILLGCLAQWLPRYARFGRWLSTGAVLAIAALIVVPVGGWLLSRLETRFPPFMADGAPVSGIVVLGGSTGMVPAPWSPRPQPNGHVDRLFTAARLAKAYPDARVLVSGGPVEQGRSEADAAAAFLTELGVAPARLALERASRDSYENAQSSYRLVRPRPGDRWLLVTSAFHMPRAIGAFRRAGFTVTAAPSDWLVGARPQAPLSTIRGLSELDLAVKEYVGLAAYWIRGRTSALFPRPT